jgi:starvation-inducible DNA-binding protein
MTELTRLKEQPGRYPAAREMPKNLVPDHETQIQTLRRDLDVVRLPDRPDGERHEKMAWIRRLFLESR